MWKGVSQPRKTKWKNNIWPPTTTVKLIRSLVVLDSGKKRKLAKIAIFYERRRGLFYYHITLLRQVTVTCCLFLIAYLEPIIIVSGSSFGC